MAALRPKPTFKVPSAKRQIAFQQLLVAARKTWLRDALAATVKSIPLPQLDRELHATAPARSLSALAALGVRGEAVFPTPIVLAKSPQLLGYYRLLLGSSQKLFYGKGGLGRFKSMETSGALTDKQRKELGGLCAAMSKSMGELVDGVAPSLTQRDVDELPLLTLGAQLQGANNNEIGRTATRAVFVALREIASEHIVDEGTTRIEIRNASGRKVRIILSSDPDVRIDEEAGETTHRKVAMEIKGGTDMSNVHNRIGEAEKSHRKSHHVGYRNLWTLIPLRGIDLDKLKRESPTTTEFYDLAAILGKSGGDWERFRDRIATELGIPVKNS